MAGALSIVHEAAHATYFSTRHANAIAGRVFALLILMNFSLYRRDHLLHHKYLGTEQDPEGQLRFESFLGILHAIVVNRHALHHWRLAVSEALDSSHSKQKWDSLILALTAAAIVTLSCFQPWLFIGYWVPLGIGLIVDNLVSLPEHALVAPAQRTAVTRSIRAPRWFEFMMYFVGDHREHHASPDTSAAQLRAWRVGSAPDNALVYTGYLAAWLCLVRSLFCPTGAVRRPGAAAVSRSMKAGKEYRVPPSPHAIEIIKAQPAVANVFPGMQEGAQSKQTP